MIEDDYDSEFRYDKDPVGALQGLAPDQVFLIGTASKALAPAVRLGWVLAPAALANPFGYGQSLCELDRLVRGSVDVVLVGPRADARTRDRTYCNHKTRAVPIRYAGALRRCWRRR